MPKRYLGNIITDTPTAPAGSFATSAASGVWSVAEANAYTKAGLWPIAGNFPLSPEDVFSTYLYTGTGSAHTIQNGIDLTEGGLVWTKSRGAHNHSLHDSARGVTCLLKSNATSAEYCDSTQISAFTSNGFTVGTDGSSNTSGRDYVSWTFRKAPKFFDVVTYTGDGTAGRTISHNLGVAPGAIFIKCTNIGYGWVAGHVGAGWGNSGALQSTDAFGVNNTTFNSTNPTDTVFTVGNSVGVNQSGQSYVAYLFAHNDGDGEFGPTGDQDIIKCGSYTGNGSTDGVTVDLGWEPQWLLFKDTTNSNDWIIIDNMRGMVVDNDLANADAYLRPNLINQEGASTIVEPTSTGFKVQNNGWTDTSGANIIYMAIRRGPMKVPTVATGLFAIATRDATEPGFDSSFPVDFALTRTVNTADNWWAASRLNQGKYLQTNRTNAEASSSSLQFDYMDGWNSNAGANSNLYAWMWKRAPNYFDVVAYTGNGTAGRTVSHNLGVAPEMMWVKGRSNSDNWSVYHKDLNVGSGQYLQLNVTQAAGTNSNQFTTTAPTSSVFSLGSDGAVNGSSTTYIAYLFASLDGVSKVGSFTGNGTTINIDCGFSSSARFVMTKRTDAGSDWVVWDTERGIVAGNDGYLVLNDVNEENSSYDSIDTYSSGFSLNYDGVATNISGASYIFYAIA
jgi:hypothetical protein